MSFDVSRGSGAAPPAARGPLYAATPSIRVPFTMVVRIATAVLVIVIMAVVGLAWALRQPNLGRGALFGLLYPGDGRFIAVVGRWADRDLVRTAKKCFRGATEVPAVSYSG